MGVAADNLQDRALGVHGPTDDVLLMLRRPANALQPRAQLVTQCMVAPQHAAAQLARGGVVAAICLQRDAPQRPRACRAWRLSSPTTPATGPRGAPPPPGPRRLPTRRATWPPPKPQRCRGQGRLRSRGCFLLTPATSAESGIRGSISNRSDVKAQRIPRSRRPSERGTSHRRHGRGQAARRGEGREGGHRAQPSRGAKDGVCGLRVASTMQSMPERTPLSLRAKRGDQVSNRAP